MMLCLDCGNTRLKWGLYDGSKWRASGALPHAEINQLAVQLASVPREVIGCNVAGADMADQIDRVLQRPVRWISAELAQCGVVNRYDNPATLGADRWAALIGARALHSGSALVVLAGTATTIDVLGADGHFLGGLILPGVTMMTNALSAGTARLSSAPGDYRPLPRNTQDAIASGALHATLGAIGRMYQTLPASETPLCLLSGGNAEQLQAHLEMPGQHVKHLILDGLIHIATATSFYPA